MRVSQLSSEAIYDKIVSPLVSQLVMLCIKHDVPIVACSTYRTTEDPSKEGSCCSANIKQNASVRMQHLLPLVQSRGIPSASVFARIMLGKDKDFDDNWYKGDLKAYAAISELADRIEQLVDVKHVFPTAIIIQTPKPSVYRVIGTYPSDAYQGIQFMRVIAVHGYSSTSVKQLCGNPKEDDDALDAMILKDILKVKKSVGKQKRK